MALQLGQGGRDRVLRAMVGQSVSVQNVYAGLYFSQNASDDFFPMNASKSLNDIAAWEILPPGTGGYARQNITPLTGEPDPFTTSIYGELVTTGPITFTPSGALALEITPTRQIGYLVLSKVTTNTSDPTDIIAFGPLLDAITAYTPGDQIVIDYFAARQS